MPDAIITSTASTFGTISGTFAADQSTVTGTVSGIVPGTLSGSVGVPGPAGSQGASGVGVPAGGTAGQYLQKIDGVDYNTDWVTLNLSAYLTDAPSDGSQYARQSGAWEVVTTPPDFITSVAAGTPLSVNSGELSIDLTSYAEKIWVESQNYASLSSPIFTGNPTAPTPATSDNDTSIATTAFVKAQGYAPLASPAFTGNPTAPTAALADNDTSIATTAFVQQELLSGTANARNLEVYVRNQTGSTIPAGSIVYINGATGNRPTITLAQANNDANSAQTFGFTKAAIANNGFGFVIVRGELENVDTSALTEGVQLYLSPTVAGAYTTTKPSAPQHLVYVGICVRAHPTQGVILVAIQNGYELGEIHDIQLGTLANNDLLAYESSTDLWKNKTFSALGLLTSADAASTYLTSATAASTYQTISGMSSYLTTASAASTYFTIASAANKADLASPAFTGTPSLPTGTIAVTQTAGNNTTAVATTAFVTAAVPAFAAATNVINDPTSTTLALNPSNIPFLLANGNYRNYCSLTTNAISGSAGVTQFGPARELYTTSTSVAGRATWFSSSYAGDFANISSPSNARVINWSKRVWIFGVAILGRGSYLGNANTICRVNLGGRTSSATGNLTTKGIGFFKVGGTSTFVNLTVHNGTTLTNVATSVTVASDASVHYVIYSDGAGNVQLYLNGTLAASTTAGPTGDSTAGANIYEEQIESATSNGALSSMHVAGAGVYIQR